MSPLNPSFSYTPTSPIHSPIPLVSEIKVIQKKLLTSISLYASLEHAPPEFFRGCVPNLFYGG